MRLASSLAIRLTGALVAATFLATASLLAGIYYFGVRTPMNEVRATVRQESAELQAVYDQRGEPALIAALTERRQAPSPNKAFDALLDRADRIHVLVELELIIATELRAQLLGVLQRQVEQAAIVF